MLCTCMREKRGFRPIGRLTNQRGISGLLFLALEVKITNIKWLKDLLDMCVSVAMHTNLSLAKSKYAVMFR